MDIKKCKYKIVVDTREQKCDHILNKFEEGFENKPSQHEKCKGIKSTYTDPIAYYKQDKGLKTGDFTIAIQLPNKEVINFQDKIVIERKASLSEICGNLVDNKSIENGINRFERELLRAKEQGIKVIVLVEVEEGYSKALEGIFRYDLASKMRPRSFIAKLFALKHRYNFELVFMNKKNSAQYIHDELYYFAREYLKDIE